MILKGFKEFINESKSSVTYQDLKLLLDLGISHDITDDVNNLIDQGKMNQEEILDWVTPICDKYGIQDWSINDDGLVDVDGSVNLEELELTQLPLRFGKVTGFFWCNHNQLTTLDGAPSWVGGSVYGNNNQLTTLEGGPEKVGGTFRCSNNRLTTLEGAPSWVGDDFLCSNNQLTTLDGAPKWVGGSFYVNNNQLTTLEGGPEKVGGNVRCKSNPLTSLDGIGEVKGEIITDFKNNESKLFENISIDLDDSNGLKFATPLSKRKLTIEKNTRYIKNGKALNSIITIKTGTTSHNYQVYVTGSPFNIESIQPDKNNMVKITYYTGKKSGQNWETKSITKSLSALSDYLPELISGKNINPMFIPFKLVRV